jgi:hypothetical protein
MKHFVPAAALMLCLFGTLRAHETSPAGVTPTKLPDLTSLRGKDDLWHGFKRLTFQVDGCQCWLAEPNNPLPGNHWVWCLMFPNAFPDRTGAPALLAKGYYYAFINVGDTFGAPSALDHLDAFYKAMTGAGFSSKVALIGLSRGGLYAYNWAARNPDKVSLIYGDAPVCNFASWPADDPVEWKKLFTTYGFKTKEEALACPSQPIKEMETLAQAHIPLFSVVGDANTTVPYADNTAIIEKEYKKLGGDITVIHKPGCNHHPHGLDAPTPIVNFIEKHDL